jgi:hypothetical protein
VRNGEIAALTISSCLRHSRGRPHRLGGSKPSAEKPAPGTTSSSLDPVTLGSSRETHTLPEKLTETIPRCLES